MTVEPVRDRRVVIIRCTKKLLRRIDPQNPRDVRSTTRLGDWTGNLIGVHRRRFVLLVSEHSRLPIVLPARDVKHIDEHLSEALAYVLRALGVAAPAAGRELAEMRESAFEPTNSRSVLGSVNEFAKAIKWRLAAEPDADLTMVTLWLSETPILPFGGKSPDILTRELLH